MTHEIEKFIIDPNRLRSLSQDVLKEAAKNGAEQAEVSMLANKGFSVTAQGGDVETVEYNQDKVIDITVYFEQRSGSVSISDVRPEAIRAAVEAACHIAKFTDTDPAAGLAEKDELAFHYEQFPSAFAWDISVEKAIELACLCEKEALQYDQRIISVEEACVATENVMHVYANSNGFLGYFPHSKHELICVAVAKQGDEMQRDLSYTISTDPAYLKSAVDVAHEAAQKTLKRLGARRLPTMKIPVIYIAEEARGFLGHFAQANQGSAIYRRASFLYDHIGKQIFPSFIDIYEQPFLSRGFGSAPFDDDGVATRANMFIEKGVLNSYAMSVYSARKLGMKTTGNSGGVHNLTIKPGDKDLKALLKIMDRGLLITELMGQGVNMVTGTYSRGAGGFWVENGEIQYPIHEVTIAGNLKDMFSHIVEVGKDVDYRGNMLTGSILLEEMMIAGS